MLTFVVAAMIGVELGQIDRRVMGFFTDIVLRASVTKDYAESAAFLVTDGDDVQCLLWPPSNEYQKHSYRGIVPSGTIAIVHTHPVERPAPSNADIAQATQLRLPMYVLTRSTITVITPFDGTKISVVERRFWMTPKVAQRCVERSSLLFDAATDRGRNGNGH
jgi:proteasome lid subunit RPN8/RPN11